MEPDHPTLDISVGAYYRILTENRGRVTRQATAALTEKRKESQSVHSEDAKKPPPKSAKTSRQKKTKEPEPVKKRSHPEPPKKKLKKLRDEPKMKEVKVKEGVKRKETKKDITEALKKYTQKFPDGFYRENILTRIACLMKKQDSGTVQTKYIRFVESGTPKGESYLVDEVDPDNFRKIKEKSLKETISLKQEKVYLILEPAWLCLSYKEQRYQPVLVLLNIGRIDIEDLQLPEQPLPADAKAQGEAGSKQSIFGKDQWALIMDLKTRVLSKCNTEFLFRYNLSLDASVRQEYMKRVSANIKFYSDLDYLYELNQKWLKDNEEVEVTEKNAGNCLFCEITFGDKRGVLLYYDKGKQGLCIQVNSINSEAVPPEVEWIFLNSPAESKVTVNMLKGRVSLPDLEKYDPGVSGKSYKPQYKHCEVQEDEDFKSKLEKQDIKFKRCKHCNYVVDDLAYLECIKCGEFLHQQCLSSEALKKGMRDLQWRCSDCIRCCLCLSSKGRDSLMVCTVCNTGYHVKCMDPDYYSQMPSSSKGKIQWKCEYCVKCIGCGTKSAGHSKQAKWSYDYTLCSKCKKKKTNNQYCPVCEQIWITTEDEPMILCSCGMWVHRSCDKTLSDTTSNTYDQSNRDYLCIKCRRNKRNMFVMQVVDVLANADKSHLFLNPVDLIAVPNYANVIKHPMCFKTMKEKAAQGIYLTDTEALRNDFELICKNAMLFNMPKTNYYKEAERVLAFGTNALNSNWTALRKFEAMTLEEEAFAKQMAEKKKSNKPLSPQQAPIKVKIQEVEEDKDESEDGSKIGRKILRKRRAINYNEDQMKDPIDSSSTSNNPLVIPAPNIPSKKQKPATKKVQQQNTVAQPKKETGSQTREKPETRQKNDSNTLHEYFEALAQQDEKTSKYLYSNPIVVQFNDPMLCFSEMCSLCGAFGNADDFVMCILCGESYHPYCITLPNGVSLDKIRKYWKCLNCKYCEHCYKATNEDKLPYCDSCDKAYHTFCLTPPLKVVPNCGWKCKDCFKCAKCGSRSYFGDHGTDHVYDYSHTNNFTYCYKCGMEEHDKSYCSICKQSSPDSSNPLKYCSTCKKWSHIKCSRITPEQYEELVTHKIDFKCFTCLMKERSSQEIHYEVCEAYLNIHNILYRHSMLSDLLHVSLKKYLAPLEEDHANSLLAAFVEANEDFFKSDLDINRFLQLQEAHVTYEEGSSTITSPSVIEERDNDQAHVSDTRRSKSRQRNYGADIKDLLEITRSCITKDKVHVPINEQVMHDVIKEDSDSEFEQMFDVAKDKTIVDMFLDQEAKNSLRIQQLKQIYRELFTSFNMSKGFDEYKMGTMIEAYENLRNSSESSLPSIIARSLQASETSHALAVHKEANEPMEDIEENKGRLQTELRVSFKSDKKFIPKGNNDTFLPKRWNVYESLYKGHPKYRQGRHFEDYIDLIGNEDQEAIDIRERRMRIEIAALVKVQEVFHRWIYDYLNTKVRELKKSLHDKSGLDRSSYSKMLDDSVKSDKHKVADNVSPTDVIDNIDSLVDNPGKNLVCCLCKQRGERKLSGRIIPFQGLLSVHVNCALWSFDVFETSEGALINFFFAYKKAKGYKCSYCGKGGASIPCSSKKCHVIYHFVCAISQQASFLHNKSVYCRQCARNKGHPPGLLQELNQKRRFFIAKNNTMFANANDMGDGVIERWKPFGYESFNRVGNLTVIRLNKKLDKIISGNYREASSLTDLDGYVCLRISWNIYDLNDVSLGLPFFASKGYFLCTGSSTGDISIKVYPRPSLNIIKPYLPPYMVSDRTIESDSKEARLMADKSAKEIWSNWLSGIKKHLPKFTLDNISLSPNDFVGLTKFPISAWLTLNAKNSEAILYSNAQTEPVKPTTGTSKKDSNVQKQSYPMFVCDLKEEVFDTIIRLNEEVGYNSTKYIAYKRAQMSPFMGKIGVRDVGAPLNSQAASKALKRGKAKEFLYESKNVKTNVKDSDLPIAMKYRSFRNMPKKVEVAPSRIHKNGLFATDE